MKAVRIILIIILVIVLLFSCWKLFGILLEYREGQGGYDALEQYVLFETPKPEMPENAPEAGKEDPLPDDTSSEEDPDAYEQETDDTVWPIVDFDELAAINPEIVGWIYIEGTSVNYPVVKGENNSYYLNHLFDGRYNSSGAIFLDANNSEDLSDPHSIIYGHRMNDKTMFYTLENFKKQEFYDEYNLALLITPTHKYKIRLFSVQVASNDENAWEIVFDDTDIGQWLEEIISKSVVSSEFRPEEGDRIISLSTCTRDFYLAKLIVHGYVERVFENVTDPQE